MILSAFLFNYGILFFNNPSMEEFPVRGIDVSHHQGDIDWEIINGIDFVFIKATEGGDYVDPEFESNWHDSANTGIRRGAYHFFSLCKGGEEQASNFIHTVPVDKNALMPVIDLEFSGQCKNIDKDYDVKGEIDIFSEILEGVYEKKPVLYVTYEFYNRYLKDRIKGYQVWIRDLYTAPVEINDGKWLFWQYSSRGKISGIDGFVDFNVFNGSKEDFIMLTEKSIK
jgi:lysozyme